jgi:4-hydroxy-3-polyprenylbenzoate decarboxylase
MTTFASLRDYLAALDRLGDLQHVKQQTDWNLEAAAAIRYSTEHRRPAPLFENVTGVPDGFRLLGAPAALSSVPGAPMARVALSIGLEAHATATDIVEHLAATQAAEPIPPRPIPRADAACKENVLLGDDANLTKFPVPFVHQSDGGRYVNTYGILVARTPDGSWTNWSICRVMMVDGKHMVAYLNSGQHGGQIRDMWFAQAKPMPYALVQGGEPAVPFVGGIPLPAGVDEAGYIGALIGRPVDVIKCETHDLEVPASAEIVIEGHMHPELISEGPFGEFAGYAPTGRFMMPSIGVEAITYRNDPIWPVVTEGRPVDEFHTVTGVGHSADILVRLRTAGLPISFAYVPLETACHWLVVTVPENWREHLPNTSTDDFARRIGEVIYALPKEGVMLPKVFVLDDDVDPTDLAELTWAIATRIHPTSRRIVFQAAILRLLTCYTDAETHAERGPHIVHDGLLPAPGEGREKQVSFAQAYPAEIRERALELLLD